ncbi:CobW family GTP-binding protein [Aeromicrobium massiliense]|uniref:CobW family GTP-binding protein n=1 Tax=Aeromicrobium massiliense TaxID=1464554 RepID=UPI0002F25590|nr:GTP-binding protein [Aeromicrobium massiliense]
MRTPVVLLTGTDRDALATTMVGLLFDLPGAVAVRHHIDVDAGVLRRVVSDMSGVLEQHEVHLEHACVSCALREDVLPTLERLATDGRWSTIVAHLPVGAEADQVCHVLALDTRLARRLRVASVVAALPGRGIEHDLLGDDLLAERGTHCGPDDRRGVAEVTCAMVEHADVTVAVGEAEDAGLDLLAALARPGASVVAGTEHLDATALTGHAHDYGRTEAWTGTVLECELPSLRSPHVWRLDLRSDRPFDPARLLDDLESLGSGPFRARGCFWLPTRPDRALVWDGAGGQLSIGDGESWGPRPPRTRLVLTGTGDVPAGLEEAFHALLVAPDAAPDDWRTTHDGFEPWLGSISA